MPKRTPGGRVKRSHNSKDRQRAKPNVVERTETESVSTTAREQAEVARSARVATAAAPGRQSLLANVRRPARPSGSALTTDYTYVMADLRRIGILASAAFVILIALTFIIR